MNLHELKKREELHREEIKLLNDCNELIIKHHVYCCEELYNLINDRDTRNPTHNDGTSFNLKGFGKMNYCMFCGEKITQEV